MHSLFVIYTLVYEFTGFLLVLALQYFLFEEAELVNQIDSMETLWHMEQRQYKLAEESIGLLNIKYHDLMHLLSRPYDRSAGDIRDRRNYKALDVGITQKAPYCRRNGISFSFIAHGIGLRSVKSVVEKYRGNVSFQFSDGVFNLNIFLPLPPRSGEIPG